MHFWNITSTSSFSATPCTPFLFLISHLTPPVFHNPSHLTFHIRGLPKLQVLPTGTLQVTWPQPWNLHFLQTYNLISLSQFHPLIPVNTKVLSHQDLQSYTKGYHPSHPHNIHPIKLALILLHPQVCFCLQLWVWYPELHHQICLVYRQHYFLLNHQGDQPLHALNPHAYQPKYPQRTPLIKPALIFHQHQVCFCLQLRVWFPKLLHQDLFLYQIMFLMKHPVDNPIQAIHPQVLHKYHPKIIQMINLTLLPHHPQVCLSLQLQLHIKKNLQYILPRSKILL